MSEPSIPDHSTDDTNLAALLARANRHADADQAEPAIALAGQALALAERHRDNAGAAEALLCIACSELRLRGRFAAALEMAQRAALQFQQAAATDGECRALATLAIAASRQGYYEMAVDSALLAVKLADGPQPTHAQVMAFHALGIAMYTGRCYLEAANAYQQAIHLAQRCEPPLNTFELHSDLASTETFRYMSERNAGGARLSLDMLQIHVDRCHELLAGAATGAFLHIAPASQGNNLLILHLTHTLLLIWSGRLDEAGVELARFEERQARLQRPWLLAPVHWGHAELALAEGDLAAARRRIEQMVAVALEHRHEGLLTVGYQMLCFLCERSGDAPAALAALRQLALREQLVRAQSLKGRLDVIERQVEMRQQTQRLQRLASDTRLYQRLAMEDGLTGLANRRQFDARLEAALQAHAATQAPFCLAMLDIDHFKQINDRFSHNTGDAVLRRIAELLRAHTREQDLPARLAGDEFVLLLQGSEPVQAAQVCRRLQDAVRDADWAALAEGLRVTVSIGLAEVQAGDTPQTLALRSDAQMYADKRRA